MYQTLNFATSLRRSAALACVILAQFSTIACSRSKAPQQAAEVASARAAAGDFDGNGTQDLLWQNDATRAARVDLYKSGAAPAPEGSALLSEGYTDWRLAASVDFNGDKTPDLIWQNEKSGQVTVHFYSQGRKPVRRNWKYLNTDGNRGWRVVTVADFDANGTPDVVWQNESTRAVTVHYFGKDFTMQGWTALHPGTKGWRVAAAADFDANGTPDLIWQDEVSRAITVHYYGGQRGAVAQSWSQLNPNGTIGWTVAGAADQNSDGHPDLVLVNDTDRQIMIHYYGGDKGKQMLKWAPLTVLETRGWMPVVPH